MRVACGHQIDKEMSVLLIQAAPSNGVQSVCWSRAQSSRGGGGVVVGCNIEKKLRAMRSLGTSGILALLTWECTSGT